MKKKNIRRKLSNPKWIVAIVSIVVVLLSAIFIHKQANAYEDTTPTHQEIKEHIPNISDRHDEKGRGATVHLEPSEAVKPEVTHKDHFKSMTQLFSHTKEGTDWKKEIKKTNSNVIIVAPHGGNLEKGTTELTKLVANQNHYNYYSFTVLNHTNPEKFHVTSPHYNDPTLLNMVKSKDFAISIHGAKGTKPVIYLGGLDTPLKQAIKHELLKQHFIVKPSPTYLGGDLKENFVNRDFKDKGVQIELSTAFRKSLFINENMSAQSRENQSNWSPVMYKFADALDQAIKHVDTSGKDK